MDETPNFNRFIYGDDSAGSRSWAQRYDDAASLQEEDLQAPSLSLESILGIQTLGMVLKDQARTKMERERKHGFSMLDDSDTLEHAAYDGSLEEAMSFRVAKVAHDQWKMRIRFRKNELSRQRNKESFLNEYLFDWLKNGNRMAFNVQKSVDASTGGTIEDILDVHAVTENEADALYDRMLRHADRVATTAIGKQLWPQWSPSIDVGRQEGV